MIQSIANVRSPPPLYNIMMDAASTIADRVEMITPARFLFNAGGTPKAWNEKKLNDPHFKVMEYEADASKVFPRTDINGGVAITYHDLTKEFEPIGIFTQFDELNSILHKVLICTDTFLSNVMYSSDVYKFTSVMHADHPEIKTMTVTVGNKTYPLLSKGHENDLTSNVMDKLGNILFYESVPNNGSKYAEFIGRRNGKRTSMWIDVRYVFGPENWLKWKVFLPKSNGSGALGEVLSTPLIGAPLIGAPLMGHTQTFISIGCFDTECEAQNCMKYIKTKFARTLLGVLKVTPNNPPAKWKYVPLQDFTPSSDIDWSQSIADIDQLLYSKYNLSDKEIAFIEEKVKAME